MFLGREWGWGEGGKGGDGKGGGGETITEGYKDNLVFAYTHRG